MLINPKYRHTRGRELPGYSNQILLTELFHHQSKGWKMLAENHDAGVAASLELCARDAVRSAAASRAGSNERCRKVEKQQEWSSTSLLKIGTAYLSRTTITTATTYRTLVMRLLAGSLRKRLRRRPRSTGCQVNGALLPKAIGTVPCRTWARRSIRLPREAKWMQKVRRHHVLSSRPDTVYSRPRKR